MSLIPSTILPGSLDSWEYFASYSDLRSWAMSDSVLNAADSLNAATHYNAHAVGEGRTITFDAWEYIASNSDLINWFRTGGVTDDDAIVATQHYIAHGATEHRLTDTFNAWEYLASNADLRDWLGADGITDADAVTAAKHYIASGANEGRAIDTFDAAEYLRLNADLRNWLGATNYEAAAKHYVESGHRENRPGTPESTYTLKATQDIVSAYNFVSAPVYTPGGDNFVNTLQNVDILTGLGSQATLDATLDNYNDNGYLIAPKLHNIESVTVHFRETDAFYLNGASAPFVSIAALDLQDSDHALKNVSVDGISVGGFIVENLHSEATNLKVELSNAAPVIAFSYLSHELAGTNDTVTLSLTDVYANYLLLGSNEGLNLAYLGSGSPTEQIEHVVLNSYGDPSVKLVDLRPDVSLTTHQDLTIKASGDLILGQDWDGDHNFIEHNNAFTHDTVESLNKITVTGSGNVTLASVGSGHFSLDLLGSGFHGFELAAGAATGKIAVNISNAAADATALFTTGSNDDTVLVDHLFGQYNASGSASGSGDTDITFAGHLVTGSGNDSVTAHDLARGDVNSNYIGGWIETGADNDVVSVDVLRGSNGKPGAGDYAGATIDLGAGIDILNADKLETEASVIAGAGNDVVNLTERDTNQDYSHTHVYTIIDGDSTGLTADGNGAKVLLGEGNDQLNILLTGTSLHNASFQFGEDHDALIEGYVDGGSGTDSLSITGNKAGSGQSFLEVVLGNTSHRIDPVSGLVTGHSIDGVEIVNLTSSTSYDSGDVSTFNGLGERKIVANDNNDNTADYALNRAEFSNNDTLPGSLTINLIHEDGVIRNQASEELPWIGHEGDAAHDYLYNLTGTEVITISALETNLLDETGRGGIGTGLDIVSANDVLGSVYGPGTVHTTNGLTIGNDPFVADLILDIAHDGTSSDRKAEITLNDMDPAKLLSPLDPGDVNYDVSINDRTNGSGYNSLDLTVNGTDNHGVDLNNDFGTKLTVTGNGAAGSGNLTIINVSSLTIETGGTGLDGGYKGNVYLGVEYLGSDFGTGVDHHITTGIGNDIVRLGGDDEDTARLGKDYVNVGSGNDTVILNGLAVGTTYGSGDYIIPGTTNSAGLTNGDTIIGGEGSDTLAFGGETSMSGTGGHDVGVVIHASEWEHVSGFETIQLSVGQSEATSGGYAEPISYYLQITDALIDTNGGTGGDLLHIVNNNLTNPANTSRTPVEIAPISESDTTIDLTSLVDHNGYNHITYVGAINWSGGNSSGGHGSDDRFIFNDFSLDSGDTIDGGANWDQRGSGIGNGDVLEIRDGGLVTAADDLQYISNVGTIEFTNSTAQITTLQLDLTDSIVDQLVNTYHTSSAAAPETLYVEYGTIYDHNGIDGPGTELVQTNAAVLHLDAALLSNFSNLYVVGDDVNIGDDIITTGGGADSIWGELGNDYIDGGAGNDYIIGGAGNDTIYGGAGNDYIIGGAGNDTIYGGEGADSISGGDGVNVINISESSNAVDHVVLGPTSSDTITGFVHASDIVELGGTFTAVGTTVAAPGADVAHRVVFDTSSHLGTNGVNISDHSAETNDFHYAVASDTGAIYYDADANWTAGSVQIGTVGVVSGLAVTDFHVA